MSKSLVLFLQEYVNRLFKDIQFAYTHTREWRRDKSRLLHELEVHGSRILTLDLPAIGKVLDKSLSEGCIQYTELDLCRYSAVDCHGHPKLFRVLWAAVFDDDGRLRKTPSLDAITALRTLYLSCKKLPLMYSRRSLGDEVDNFFAIERDIRSPSLTWDGDRLEGQGPRPHFVDLVPDSRNYRDPWGATDIINDDTGLRFKEWDVLQQVCDRISSQLGDFSIEKPSELPKHGPGVVSNQKKGTSKYSFKEWPQKLDHVFPRDYYAHPTLGGFSSLSDDPDEFSQKESPSRLIAVPKTLKGPRLIAAEPNQQMWIQQLILNQLVGRLKHTDLSECVNFDDQRRNQEFALLGSKSGDLCTIDLSSASDRLSCWVVERVFRANETLLYRLHAARTRWLVSDVGLREKKYLVLKKFAAQGSATTFPVQSIAYACVAIAAHILAKGHKVTTASIRRASRQVAVFGDDIVAPSFCRSVLVEMLSDMGLKVNTNKSFWNGNFRESCGLDAFGGYDVTPPYLKSIASKVPLSQYSSIVDVSNNYHRKGYWHTAEFLRQTLQVDDGLVPIVSVETDYPGLVSFCGTETSHLRKKWDKGLQKEVSRVILPHSKTPLLDTDPLHRVFQYFIERPSPDAKFVSGTRGRVVVTFRPGWIPTEYIS